MRSFLVETYLATGRRAELDELVARARSLEKPPAVRHLGSLVLVDDEVCFHVFEAASMATLVSAADEAGLSWERVIATIWRSGTGA